MEMYSTALSLLISCNQDTQHQTDDTRLSRCDGSTNQRTEERVSHTAFIPFPHPHQQSSKGRRKKIKLFFLLILIIF